MQRSKPQRRHGYTLLEVLISSLIALILLAGLYGALDVTLVRMDVNRDMITTNDLSRAIFNRVTVDLTNTLGPLPPRSGGKATFGTSSASSSNTTTTSNNDAETGETTTPRLPTTQTDDGTSAAAAGLDLPLGAGVIGSDKQLKIFLSRVPTSIVDFESMTEDGSQTADLRSVIYYLSSEGRGLCRQERFSVTMDGIWNDTEPDRSNERADLIAPEVLDVLFEYYDGGTWQSSWDGSATDLDGESLVGPPRAIRVTLLLEISGRTRTTQKQVTQTIAIRSAVGNFTSATTEPKDTTTPDTTSSTTPSEGN